MIALPFKQTRPRLPAPKRKQTSASQLAGVCHPYVPQKPPNFWTVQLSCYPTPSSGSTASSRERPQYGGNLLVVRRSGALVIAQRFQIGAA